MKKILETLKVQLKGPLQKSRLIWNQEDVDVENDIQDLKEILNWIKNKSIKIKSNDGSNTVVSNTTCEDQQKEGPRRRGRPPKTSTMSSEARVKAEARSDSSDCVSLNDSSASTSSNRSRRAAAQAAEHKLAQVQSLVQLNTKLRRPTNFDDKQAKAVSSPPAKCRRTQRNQSAGSSSSQTDDINSVETNKNLIENVGNSETQINKHCSVSIEKIDTPTIESHTGRTRSSRSLDRASREKSGDLFGESKPPNSDPLPKSTKKKSISKIEEFQLLKTNLPIAQSSPILVEQCDEEFKGFDEQIANINSDILSACAKEISNVVDDKREETQVLSKRTIEKQEIQVTEKIDTTVTKSKTKILRSRETRTIISVEEKENVNRNNETHIIASKPDLSPNLRSRTKVLKKSADDEVNEVERVDSSSSPEIKAKSRAKTFNKHNEHGQDIKSDGEISDQKPKTKTLKNKNEKGSQSDSSDTETSGLRSRTKTIRKGKTTNLNNDRDQDYLVSELKNNPLTNKTNRVVPLSPAPAKGELVKKRIEDFEKMQNGTDESEEEMAVGRLTRNTKKNMPVVSATEVQSSKQTRNIAMAKLQASGTKPPMSSERARMTPLGSNLRITPGLESAHKTQINKGLGSSNRPEPSSLIHKQAAEETERKRKEEERSKRQAKEEEAKRKKEKVLKATAEETRRKREQKLQKVAATREAAEKEKERLAAKAEKEKEEKMRQIAIEKEKQKEEQLKKKQLQQQKSQEHEERRRQEEAARLAKLQEQEEEHKRQQALRERELELQKQHKAELRLAEAEKLKLQGVKLGKIAAVNNAKLKLQQGTTPSEKPNSAQPSNCYEITPAREDRPLLPPKSENDYGIDDAHSGDSSDDESQPRKMIPLWAQSKNRERLLTVNKYIPKKAWDLFMECDPCPDINKIFAGNPIKRRIRTSSAVWRTPPKYSRVAP